MSLCPTEHYILSNRKVVFLWTQTVFLTCKLQLNINEEFLNHSEFYL